MQDINLLIDGDVPADPRTFVKVYRIDGTSEVHAFVWPKAAKRFLDLCDHDPELVGWIVDAHYVEAPKQGAAA